MELGVSYESFLFRPYKLYEIGKGEKREERKRENEREEKKRAVKGEREKGRENVCVREKKRQREKSIYQEWIRSKKKWPKRASHVPCRSEFV